MLVLDQHLRRVALVEVVFNMTSVWKQSALWDPFLVVLLLVWLLLLSLHHVILTFLLLSLTKQLVWTFDKARCLKVLEHERILLPLALLDGWIILVVVRFCKGWKLHVCWNDLSIALFLKQLLCVWVVNQTNASGANWTRILLVNLLGAHCVTKLLLLVSLKLMLRNRLGLELLLSSCESWVDFLVVKFEGFECWLVLSGALVVENLS